MMYRGFTVKYRGEPVTIQYDMLGGRELLVTWKGQRKTLAWDGRDVNSIEGPIMWKMRGLCGFIRSELARAQQEDMKGLKGPALRPEAPVTRPLPKVERSKSPVKMMAVLHGDLDGEPVVLMMDQLTADMSVVVGGKKVGARWDGRNPSTISCQDARLCATLKQMVMDHQHRRAAVRLLKAARRLCR